MIRLSLLADIDDRLAGVETRADLQAAMILLPDENRRVVYYSVVMGYSNREIAKALGMKIAAVAATLADSLRDLRHILKEDYS